MSKKEKGHTVVSPQEPTTEKKREYLIWTSQGNECIPHKKHQAKMKLRFIRGYTTYGMRIENIFLHVVYILQRHLLGCEIHNS
jgi:hypothetical protein